MEPLVVADIPSRYRNLFLSDEPDMKWIARGVAGIRLYIMHALAAKKNNDKIAFADNLSNADRLLVFLLGIGKSEEKDDLGDKLGKILMAVQHDLLKATLEDDEKIFQSCIKALETLGPDLLKLNNQASS